MYLRGHACICCSMDGSQYVPWVEYWLFPLLLQSNLRCLATSPPPDTQQAHRMAHPAAPRVAHGVAHCVAHGVAHRMAHPVAQRVGHRVSHLVAHYQMTPHVCFLGFNEFCLLVQATHGAHSRYHYLALPGWALSEDQQWAEVVVFIFPERDDTYLKMISAWWGIILIHVCWDAPPPPPTTPPHPLLVRRRGLWKSTNF